MESPKWKRFEHLAFEIQKELAADAEVKLDDSIDGVDSKVKRQIDISIRKKIGQYSILIVIDCKDYAEPLDVKDIEAFAGMVKDVRAHRGALIVSSGFTPAALSVAKNEGIDTYRLVDTENVDWKIYASIPCLLDRTFFSEFSFRFESVPFQPFVLPTNQKEFLALEFASPDGVQRGTLPQIVRSKWDKAEMPRVPGRHAVPLGDDLVSVFRGHTSHAKVTAIAIVVREWYFGPLPVKLRGLEDLQTGGVITRTVTTDIIDFANIESGKDSNWKRINDPAQLAVIEPAIHLGYFDVFSDDVVPNKRAE